MSERVVGVLHHPRGEDYGFRRLPHKRPRRLYWRAVWWKANPRDAQYMRDLFAERYPDGDLHEGTSPPAADRTVLLYPDSIGLGFGPLERQLRGRRLHVLNGRRRSFELDRPTLRALRVRRAIERAMLLEAVAFPLFLALAVPLALFDALRGRT